MKLALIPPASMVSTASASKYHLVLPQVMDAHSEYEAFYNHQLDASNFIILDNGAAEGEMVDTETLLEYAHELMVDEVVAPDVMYDGLATVDLFAEFVEVASGWWTKRPNREPQVMVVAQGQTYNDVLEMIQNLMSHPYVGSISCIGIPRHLIETLNEPYVRISLAADINKSYISNSQFRPFDIHFLGAAPSWPQELQRAQKEVPFVRGMDTSMPYNYTWHGRRVDDEGEPVSRPENYFDLLNMGSRDDQLLSRNISTMMNWAHGND